jgi:hypothetical protein
LQWISVAGSGTALRANRANHPVGWVAATKAQNRQCSCGCYHPSPFSAGSNFVLFQRYVLIEIRALKPLQQSPLKKLFTTETQRYAETNVLISFDFPRVSGPPW